jgi:hypothetical protein
MSATPARSARSSRSPMPLFTRPAPPARRRPGRRHLRNANGPRLHLRPIPAIHGRADAHRQTQAVRRSLLHQRDEGGKHVIGLPNGRTCSLLTYRAEWPTLKTVDPEAEVKGWESYPCKARDILRRLDEGLHDRINRHGGRYGRGRKWEARYQLDLRRDARRINEYAFRRLVDPVLRVAVPELQCRSQWSYTRDGLEIALHNTRRRAAPTQ